MKNMLGNGRHYSHLNIQVLPPTRRLLVIIQATPTGGAVGRAENAVRPRPSSDREVNKPRPLKSACLWNCSKQATLDGRRGLLVAIKGSKGETGLSIAAVVTEKKSTA